MDSNLATGTMGAHFALVISGETCSGCVIMPDRNHDGIVDADDLRQYFADYSKGRADVDGDGRTSPADAAAFISAYVGALAGIRP